MTWMIVLSTLRSSTRGMPCECGTCGDRRIRVADSRNGGLGMASPAAHPEPQQHASLQAMNGSCAWQRRPSRDVSRRLGRRRGPVCGSKSHPQIKKLIFKDSWRRGWDSNPRYSCPYFGFRDRPVRPLRHLSDGVAAIIRQRAPGNALRDASLVDAPPTPPLYARSPGGAPSPPLSFLPARLRPPAQGAAGNIQGLS
jgi:hypothetical protein